MAKTPVAFKLSQRGLRGMTLRNRQRAQYYEQPDQLFPGLHEMYEPGYSERYSAGSRNAPRRERVFDELAGMYKLNRVVPPYVSNTQKQLALFKRVPEDTTLKTCARRLSNYRKERLAQLDRCSEVSAN